MYRTTVWIIFIVMLLSGCGHQLPAAGTELVQEKTAVLVISEQGLDPQAADSLEQALHSWNRTELITYDWKRDISTVDDSLMKQIRERPADYIFVVGNDLISQFAGRTGEAAEHKWVLLQDRFDPATLTDVSNAMVRGLSADRVEKYWGQWVLQQLDAGATFEWITKQDAPIPSLWAPSEEADHILSLDLYGDTWQDQLTYQIQHNKPGWIAVFTTLTPDRLNKIKGYNIPVVLMSPPPYDMKWAQVWGQLLAMMKNNSWQAGVFPYSDDLILKK